MLPMNGQTDKMLLTDEQRGLLARIEAGAAALGAAGHRILDLTVELRRRDVDAAKVNAPTETGADLVLRARERYQILRQAAVDAANALPVI
jgi:hypothetical protein